MITAIGFDADDTLWHNENIFASHHRQFQALLARYHDADTVERALFATEMRNLELFGYGAKSFALSSIETAIDLTHGAISAEELREIIRMVKAMIAHPVELLEGAAETVAALARDFRLLAITKGELYHQELKFRRSGLAGHFAHLEIVSEKDGDCYRRILQRHGLDPAGFLMVGNSLRSDILPVLEIGGQAAYVPYPLIWQGEAVSAPPADDGRFHTLANLRELPALVARLNQ